jgi:hypothetical protein
MLKNMLPSTKTGVSFNSFVNQALKGFLEWHINRKHLQWYISKESRSFSSPSMLAFKFKEDY